MTHAPLDSAPPHRGDFLEDHQKLTAGTKFLLFGYDNASPILGIVRNHFAGLRNGSLFTLGMNEYRILFNDTSANAHDITSTVMQSVPEPSTLSVLGLGGFMAMALGWSKRIHGTNSSKS